jgi:hypothetical protein
MAAWSHAEDLHGMLAPMVAGPSPRKNNRIVVVIIVAVLGGLALLAAVVVAGVAFWWKGNKARILDEGKQAIAEGERFATGRAQADCVDAGLRRGMACGAVALDCEVKSRLFTTSCLEHADPTPGFCDGVPPREEILATSTWIIGECQRRGNGSQRCTRLLQAIPEACHGAVK